MKIQTISIQNAIGCREFTSHLNAPVTLIAGPNGAGKSSIIQAVRFALTGAMPRVSLKKDAKNLVSEGAKTGSINVSWTRGIAPDLFNGKAGISLPDCELVRGEKGDIHPALPYVCDMHRFAGLADNDRRAFLFGLTGISASTEEVRQRLTTKGAASDKIEAILPLLRSGFPAAHKEAASRATEAKGAWRAVTGEAYGAKKAEGWQADKPAYNADELKAQREAIQTLEGRIEKGVAFIGDKEACQRRYVEQAGKLEGLQEAASLLSRKQDKLNLDREELKTWSDKLKTLPDASVPQKRPETAPCPSCGELLCSVAGGLAKFSSIQIPAYDIDPEADSKRKQWSDAVALYTRAVENGERDLAVSEAAAKELETLKSAGLTDLPDDAIIEASKVSLAELKAEKAGIVATVKAMEQAERDAATADKKTSDAARHHADVAAWTLIADALAPDGIPGELLAQALKPINAILAQSAADTGWMPVTMDAEMDIRAAGRPYALLSESEQWRTDAMLTAAISQLSGLKLFLLDRLDVLDLQGRSEALGWLDTMAAEGEIETCLVAATLKALPSGLPATFQGFWIENGSVGKQ